MEMARERKRGERQRERERGGRTEVLEREGARFLQGMRSACETNHEHGEEERERLANGK